ncbi:hypothetical protein BKA93DRAFT_762298 [Sparassis latifolia]|uniref:choline-phosphate cytidylyltransferase n=1 Tax=Sparassis crispa TaxID=139825 RepID=A0A401GY17_9APHY|nr:hypothetical protein SCP_1003650 [Sparassis crispa]GBE87118.1 hypothetical protein SCP_1003650 [Sparassis crispa]
MKTTALHAKRSFAAKHVPPVHPHPYSRPVPDSPAAYDASEEDNDPLTDDAGSTTDAPSSGPSASSTRLPARMPAPAAPRRPKHALAALVSDDDAGTDSPTYDGDIESSTTAGPDHDHTQDTPAPSMIPLPAPPEPSPAAVSVYAFDPAKLTPQDIQDYARRAIAREGEEGQVRPYLINRPPIDRPVRIYADGVYDLFHLGHALQLRQAKLSFSSPSSPNAPSDPLSESGSGVYLLVGVNSDEQCEEHKNIPVMNHAERCEAVRHCRWVDQVIPDAPWVIDEAFISKHKIDYVAHDEDLYPSAGQEDVYAYAKSQGKFLPTRRTPGISTSELLERIVSRYRMRDFDKKLARMGHSELVAEGSDWDGSKEISRSPSVE